MSDTDGKRKLGLTPRALFFGILMVAAINLGSPYAEWILHSQLLTTNYFPIGMMFLFVVMVMIINVALKWVRRSWALSPSELAIVFVMTVVATAIPTYGISGYMMATIAAPYYFATNENRWAEYFHRFIPDWAAPHGGEGMKWFFEGLPAGQGIPWGIWIPPLLWWLSFILFGLFACLCIVVILRRQWMEHERLTYPLAEVAVEMIEGSDDGGLTPRFGRSFAFWIGFGISLFTVVWNIAGYFYPLLPKFPTAFRSLQIARSFPPIFLTLYLPMISIAFFLKLDVSFSIWFFVLVGVMQEGVFNRLGFSISSSLSVYHYDASRPALAWQSFGAFVMMVGINLYMARRHLARVARKAVGFSKGSAASSGDAVDDSREILPYRWAVWGLVISMCYLTFWFCHLGMSLATSLLLNVTIMVCFMGISRLVVEGGLVFVRGPLTAQSFTMNVMGNSALSGADITAMGMSFAWFADPISTFMPHAANAAKAGYDAKTRGRSLFIAIIAAVIVSIGISVPFTLLMGYRHGAYNYGTWLFGRGAQVGYEYIVHALHSPPGVEWNKLGWMVMGGIVMLMLTLLRYRFSWWPVNPIGFPVGTVFKVRWCVFPIFLGWLVRSAIMRTGSMSLFNRSKPFFVGLMLGWFFGAGLSVLTDWIFFFGEGHVIYWH